MLRLILPTRTAASPYLSLAGARRHIPLLREAPVARASKEATKHRACQQQQGSRNRYKGNEGGLIVPLVRATCPPISPRRGAVPRHTDTLHIRAHVNLQVSAYMLYMLFKTCSGCSWLQPQPCSSADQQRKTTPRPQQARPCLLYTSDAADE